MKWLILFSTVATGALLASGMLIESRLDDQLSAATNNIEPIVETKNIESTNEAENTEATNQDLQPEQIKEKARAMTVKVLTGKTWGSGILINRQDNVYTIVTNRHVLVFSQDKTYQVQTFDGTVYPARIVEKDFEGRDLALLEIESSLEYEIVELAPIASSTLLVEQSEVFAVGFPIEIEGQEQIKGFYFNDGHIVKFSDLEFGGGYQIAYTNSVKKGMSGGALLNKEGKVIGINGMHKYPLWGNPYEFIDGSLASESQQKEMSEFSWAIPINTFLDLAPQFSTSKK